MRLDLRQFKFKKSVGCANSPATSYKVVCGIAFTGMVLFALLLAAIWYMMLPKPELTRFQSYSVAVFDSQQTLLNLKLAADQRYRLYTPLADIPKQMRQAVILYEDQSYYSHLGVDFAALARAFWQTYVLQERRIGASTLVMQVARLRWNIPSSSIGGKLEQIYRAIQLSKHYDKDELLEAYFNLAPYGGNVEGIGAASLIYFGKLPAQLSFSEMLTLAVVPQNPNKRHPGKQTGLTYLQPAKQQLFERWIQRYPQDKHYTGMVNLPLATKSIRDLPKRAPHFTQFVYEQLPPWYAYQIAKDTSGNNGAKLQHEIGSKVVTALNYNLQKVLDEALKAYVKKHNNTGMKNATALLLNYETMHIEAMIGSANFYNDDIQGQVNGTLAKRSPGSTLKPFVYALALDAGIIHPMSMLKDLPKRYAAFSPENFGRGFLGPISATQALVKSRNVPAVALQSELIDYKKNNQNGLDLYDFLQKAGVAKLRSADFYGLALSLGGAEVSMLELVQLYAGLANGGLIKNARSIMHTGAFQKTTTQRLKNNKTLLSPEASFMVLKMLQKNPPPTQLTVFDANIKKKPVAWKTGTSWAYRDAWAIGISGKHVLAVWIGNFTGQGNNSFIGRSAAGPLMFKLFDIVHTQNKQPNSGSSIFDIDPRLNLAEIDVCSSTGDLYEKDCPHQTKSLFIPGVSPIKSSNIYRKVLIDNNTGLRRCDRNTHLGSWEVYSFWSTEFRDLFRKAGIFIKQLPSFMPDCRSNKIDDGATKPQIISPIKNVQYIVKVSSVTNTVSPEPTATIELKANAAAGVSVLHWFVDGNYLGKQDIKPMKTSAGHVSPMLWHAKPGTYWVSVADDFGHSNAQQVKVLPNTLMATTP